MKSSDRIMVKQVGCWSDYCWSLDTSGHHHATIYIKRISLRHVNFGVVATPLRGHCVAVAKRESKKKSKKKNCTNMKIEHCCKICHAPYNVKTTTSPFSTVTLMIRRHYWKKLSRPQRSKCLVEGNNLYSFFPSIFVTRCMAERNRDKTWKTGIWRIKATH